MIAKNCEEYVLQKLEDTENKIIKWMDTYIECSKEKSELEKLILENLTYEDGEIPFTQRMVIIAEEGTPLYERIESIIQVSDILEGFNNE